MSFAKKIKWYHYLSVLFFITAILIQGVNYFSKEEIIIKPKKIEVNLSSIAPIPIRNATNSAQIELENSFLSTISAKAAYVIDLDSSAVLLHKNENEKLYPASTTKIMTALLVRELFNLEDEVVVPANILDMGNGMGLVPGEKIKVKDLLAGLLIPSGNDAAFALSSHHPMGMAGFVVEMNEKSAKLHLSETKFHNPSGFDHQEQLTTAKDLAILTRELLKDDFLKELVKTKEMVVHDVDNRFVHQLANTNKLLGVEDGVYGVKTGTTWLAGEVLVSLVERENHPILVVLMTSQDRYSDTKMVIDWVFSKYQWFLEDEIVE